MIQHNKIRFYVRKLLLVMLFMNMSVILPGYVYSSSEVERSVVKIIGKKVGTGFLFFISKEKGNVAYVITAYHVVKDFDIRNEYRVMFNFSDYPYIGKVKYIYPEVDLAILSLDSYPDGVRPLRFGDLQSITAGSKVYIYGYPGGGQIRRDDGTVSSSYGNKIYLDDIAPDYGNSGGPLLNSQTNTVVGMIVQKSIDASKQYAISIQQIRTFVENNIIFKRIAVSKSEPEPITYISLRLRSRKDTLSEENAKAMIIKHDFYEKKINPAGNGISNQYKLYKMIRSSLGSMRAMLVSEKLAQSVGMKKPYGSLIVKVEANTLADYSGFKKGDIVVELDGIKVDHHWHFVKLVHSREIGQIVNVKLLRDGKLKTMSIKMGSSEDAVVLDYTTGLMWVQNADNDISQFRSHKDTEGHISFLNYIRFAGYNDWRLPTLEEAMSLMESEEIQKISRKHLDPIFEGSSEEWTADKYWGDCYWKVNFNNGLIHPAGNLGFVRAVRGR